MTWARRNLLNTWYNSALTVTFGGALLFVAFRLVRFVFVTARWDIIRTNLTVLLVRTFPRAELWRIWLAMYVITVACALFAGALHRRATATVPQGTAIARRAWPIALFLLVMFALRPNVVGMLAVGGLVVVASAAFRTGSALPVAFRAVSVVSAVAIVASYAAITAFDGVDPDGWGGLMLTFALASVGIVLSFPLGVALALGRRSSLPAIRAVCTGYIELIRGVPLLTVLFMGFFVIGFVLPPGTHRPQLITRALVSIVLFTAAYIAEIVRGGLAAVGRRQTDAARAVGLSTVGVMRFVVLPQALRAVIPGLVGQFITLFKDTSLVAIVGLSELLGTTRALTSQNRFLAQGLQAETLVFAAFIYWVFSYTMSRESQRLERRLGVGIR